MSRLPKPEAHFLTVSAFSMNNFALLTLNGPGEELIFSGAVEVCPPDAIGQVTEFTLELPDDEIARVFVRVERINADPDAVGAFAGQRRLTWGGTITDVNYSRRPK